MTISMVNFKAVKNHVKSLSKQIMNKKINQHKTMVCFLLSLISLKLKIALLKKYIQKV